MYQDLRQSKKWGEYLSSLGWKSYRTPAGTNVWVLKKGVALGGFVGISIAKIQRPTAFDEKELDAIEAICRKQKCVFVNIEPELDQNLSVLTNRGYRKDKNFLLPEATLIINLQKSESELFYALSHSAKYSVKRAEREDAIVEFYANPSPDVLTTFHTILKESAQNTKIMVPSLRDLTKKVGIFGEDFILAVSKSKADGKIYGGLCLIANGKKVLYLHGGTTSAGRRNKAGYLLYWRTILYLKERGFHILDLEGIADPQIKSKKSWAGFTDFKLKFGGEKIIYPGKYIKFYSKIFEVLYRLGG